MLQCFSLFDLVTAIGGRPKPEICFLPGRLGWTLLPKERYGDSLSGRGSNTQPSNCGRALCCNQSKHNNKYEVSTKM